MAWPYPERSRTRTALWVGASAIAAVVVVSGVVVVAGDDDGTTSSGDASPVDTGPVTTTIEETRPVEVVGEPLAKLTDVTNDPAVGKPVPQVHGQSFNGTPVDIEPGQNTMLFFYAHWSPNSRGDVEFLADYYDYDQPDHPLPPYNIVIISTQVKPDQPSYPPSKRIREWGDPYVFPVMADDENDTAAKAFAFKTFPLVVLIDADGNLVARFPSNLDPILLTEGIPQIFAGAAEG